MSYPDFTEAGGGSYPEPPYVPEPDIPECEECYDTESLSVIDGHLLCPHCKADYIFRHADYGDYMRYILDNFQNRYDYFVKWVFDGLSNFEKQIVVRYGFEKYATRDAREALAKSYVAEDKLDFAEFMERTRGRRAV